MKKSKIKALVLASSIFLASNLYSQDFNLNPKTSSEIIPDLITLTNLAENAQGWKMTKIGDSREYTTLQNGEFVLIRTSSNGIERVCYAGNGKLIWDNIDANAAKVGLDPRSDSFEEIKGTNRTSYFVNPSVENQARVNNEYKSTLENLGKNLNQSKRRVPFWLSDTFDYLSDLRKSTSMALERWYYNNVSLPKTKSPSKKVE